MKKLILSLLIVLMATSAFAAGTMTFVVYEADKRGKHWIQIVATCTADGVTANFSDSEVPYDVSGKYLMQVKTFYSGTPVTTDSDLQLNQHSLTGYDVLNGAGLNMVDDNTNKDFQPTIDSVPSAVPVYGPLFINIDNNAVVGAIHTIILEFIQ